MPTPETRDGAILEHLLHFVEKTRHQGDPSAVCQRDYGPSTAPPLSQEAERRALHAHGSDLWRGLVEAQQRMSAQPRYDHATMGTSTTNSVDMEHAISCAQSVLLWSQVRSSVCRILREAVSATSPCHLLRGGGFLASVVG